KGGPSWLENEVAACRRCNRERGHLSPTDWLAECERRGWRPDTDRVARVLDSLAGAIAARGGQADRVVRGRRVGVVVEVRVHVVGRRPL
ncbi:hypothetical protein K7G98_40510, partial [Saccharothrix sp. MB29]|nr:hypothetical protein [Saccharothrix sp. MB29]